MQLNNRTFRCTNVLYGTCCGTILEIIDPKSIIQKLAFRRGVSVNFPPTPNSIFFFHILIEVAAHNAMNCSFYFFSHHKDLYI